MEKQHSLNLILLYLHVFYSSFEPNNIFKLNTTNSIFITCNDWKNVSITIKFSLISLFGITNIYFKETSSMIMRSVLYFFRAWIFLEGQISVVVIRLEFHLRHKASWVIWLSALGSKQQTYFKRNIFFFKKTAGTCPRSHQDLTLTWRHTYMFQESMFTAHKIASNTKIINIC